MTSTIDTKNYCYNAPKCTFSVIQSNILYIYCGVLSSLHLRNSTKGCTIKYLIAYFPRCMPQQITYTCPLGNTFTHHSNCTWCKNSLSSNHSNISNVGQQIHNGYKRNSNHESTWKISVQCEINSKQLIPRLLLRKMQQFLRTNIHVQWNLMPRISEGKETWFIKN